MSDNLGSTEPTVEQLAAANAALLAGPQPTAPVVVETPAPVVVETPAPVVVETPALVVVETPAPVVVETPALVVVETPAPVVVETPVAAPATVVDEKVDFWANSWFSRNKQ